MYLKYAILWLDKEDGTRILETVEAPTVVSGNLAQDPWSGIPYEAQGVWPDLASPWGLLWNSMKMWEPT